MDEQLTKRTLDAVKKKKNPKHSEFMSVQTNPGDNTKYLEHSMRMWKWPSVDMKDNGAVEARVLQYFQLCADDDMKPSVEGLALAFGVNRRTMTRWMTGDLRPKISPTIQKAYQLLNAQMADYMQNGKINPVSGIFLMKNNMGYQDKQEVVLTPNNPLGDETPVEELQQKYIETTASDYEPES